MLAIELAARTKNLKNYFKFQYTPVNVIIIKVKVEAKFYHFGYELNCRSYVFREEIDLRTF